MCSIVQPGSSCAVALQLPHFQNSFSLRARSQRIEAAEIMAKKGNPRTLKAQEENAKNTFKVDSF
jgi:hypothetical protein